LTQISGVEHVPQTALPSSIDGINPLLAGHNGQTDDLVFDDLPKAKVGNTFYIDMLGQELVYRVDKISTVRPNDVNEIRGYSGKHYATLMTCTPRYVNSFRLLVRGRLVAVKDLTTGAVASMLQAMMPVISTLAVGVVYACVIIALVRGQLADPLSAPIIVAIRDEAGEVQR
jgi:LPXTG-site transpeptidase (sortase) family protein